MGAAARYNPEFPFSAHTRSVDREQMLAEIVRSVWESVLGLPVLLRATPENLDADPSHTHTLTGAVHMTGAWQGTVAATAPLSLASECAAQMLGADPDGVPLEDVTDGWGELVNMIGGNLKALIAPPCAMSLPCVVEGTTYSYRVPRTNVLNELTFACMGKRIRVVVLQRDDSGNG
jgi:chemotaxis protein CheX